MSEHVYANIDCLCSSKNYHVRKSRAKHVDTFDIVFSDNRISVTSNDVYIDSLGVAHHYGEGETRLHEGHRVIDTSWLATFVCRECPSVDAYEIEIEHWIASESTCTISSLFLNEMVFIDRSFYMNLLIKIVI